MHRLVVESQGEFRAASGNSCKKAEPDLHDDCNPSVEEEVIVSNDEKKFLDLFASCRKTKIQFNSVSNVFKEKHNFAWLSNRIGQDLEWDYKCTARAWYQ